MLGGKLEWVLILIGFIICVLPSDNGEVKLDYPKNWPALQYDTTANKLTDEGVALGRKLFYDPILSRDSSISCSHCHLSYTAFAHTDHKLSHGIGDSIGMRNAPSLSNLQWNPYFMWDGAINHLDKQALAPITDHREMAESLDHVLEKLNRNTNYKEDFKSVFGTSTITTTHLTKSLSQFQLTFISSNSKYDSVSLGLTTYNKQEEAGHQLFLQHCNSCHTAPLFTNYSFKNNGIVFDSALNDMGRYAITLAEEDKLRFKVPSLRNVSVTPPYMHNGSIRSLKGVLTHYAYGANHPSNGRTDVNITFLTKGQQGELLVFLESLTDFNFIKNKSLAYPNPNNR